MGFKKQNIIFVNPDDANLENLNKNDDFLEIFIADEDKVREKSYIVNKEEMISSENKPDANDEKANDASPETKKEDNSATNLIPDDDVNLEFLFNQLPEIENVIIIEDDDDIMDEIVIDLSDLGEGGEGGVANEANKAEQKEDVELLVKSNNNIIDDNLILKINNHMVSDERKNNEDGKSERLESKEDIVIKPEPLIEEKPKEPEVVKLIEPVVKMKDKKILVNLEDLDKEYSRKEHYLFGEINYKDKEEMKILNQEVELMHPRVLKNGTVASYPLCTNMGNFCCSNKTVNQNLKELGLGMMCYFKVLKVFIWCFFIITLLNLHLYYIYTTNNTERKVTGYRDVIFKTTIGNIASSKF
jgi:hypothetical protein